MTNYFVSPTGNDANNGSSGSPWLTLHKAVSTIGTGDTAFFANGTYPIINGGEFTSCTGTIKSTNLHGAKITEQADKLGAQMLTMYNDGMVVDGFEITGPDMQIALCPHGAQTIQNCLIHDVCNNANNAAAGGGIIQDGGGTFGTLAGPLVIQNNFLYNIGQKTAGVIVQNNLQHPIYVNCPMTNRSTVQNNVCVNCSGDGLNMYHQPKNFLVTNNTFVNCLTKGIECYGDSGSGFLADNNTLQNNIIDQCGTGNAILSNTATGSNNQFLNNLAFGSYSTTYALGSQASSNLANANPVLANPVLTGRGTYHISKGSPAIGKASIANTPLFDINNAVRPGISGYSVGAYEFNPQWGRF